MQKEIWQIVDADECHDKNGIAVPFFRYAQKNKQPTPTVVRRNAETATLEELVELCDHDAENRNAHDFCGAHRVLAALLYRELGRTKATVLMYEIAKFGGLQGMNGVACDGDAFEELGVGVSGRVWDGTFGK